MTVDAVVAEHAKCQLGMAKLLEYLDAAKLEPGDAEAIDRELRDSGEQHDRRVDPRLARSCRRVGAH